MVNEDNDERTRAIFLLFEFRRDRRTSCFCAAKRGDKFRLKLKRERERH